MKPCNSCGERKELSEFRLDANRPDGRRSSCRLCTAKADVDYRERLGAELPKRRKGWHSNYRVKHPARVTASRIAYRSNNPLANRAHNVVNKAVGRGRLERPKMCEWCGHKGRIEATHGDYSKPYEVLWLCTPCHRRRDRGERS